MPPQHLWLEFMLWAGANGVSVEHEDDYQPWYDCFVAGAKAEKDAYKKVLKKYAMPDTGLGKEVVFDPLNAEQREKILSHHNVKVEVLGDPESTDKLLRPTWGYLWKYGGVTMAPAESWCEEFARSVAALAVYLYISGVPPHLDDRLAVAFMREAYIRLGKQIRPDNANPK